MAETDEQPDGAHVGCNDMVTRNPFDDLSRMFPDRRFHVIGGMFDAEPLPTKHQWILSGLAMLLHCLDVRDEVGRDTDDETMLDVTLLRELRALEAAYMLGVRDGVRGVAKAVPVRFSG